MRGIDISSVRQCSKHSLASYRRMGYIKTKGVNHEEEDGTGHRLQHRQDWALVLGWQVTREPQRPWEEAPH